jgi:hypothetical protein
VTDHDKYDHLQVFTERYLIHSYLGDLWAKDCCSVLEQNGVISDPCCPQPFISINWRGGYRLLMKSLNKGSLRST